MNTRITELAKAKPGDPNLEAEPPKQFDSHAPGKIDEEIHVGGIVWTMVGVTALTLVCYALMWGMMVGMRNWAAKQDPPASPIPEAAEVRLPPAPRLQVESSFAVSEPHHNGAQSDVEDMRDMRLHEKEMLTRPGAVDPQQGTMRIPIDVAIDAVARRGVGAEILGAAPAAAAAVPAGTEAPSRAPAH